MANGSGTSKTGLSYNEILSIAATLSTASTNMGKVLNTTKVLLNKVGTDSVWSGTAASEAKTKFDALSKQFPEFTQSVDDMSKYLKQVVANYQTVDSAVKGNKK